MKRPVIFIMPVLLLIMISACERKPEGPFFGNGVHNGWADQNSVEEG